MKTAPEFTEYVDGIRAHDGSLAVAIHELLRRADADGRAERTAWISAVRHAYTALAPFSGSDSARLEPVGQEKLGSYVEEQVVTRLERAGIAFRHPDPEAWEALVWDPELWAAVAPERDAHLARAEARVAAIRRLGSAGGNNVRPAPADSASRLYAEGLTKSFRGRTVVQDVDISVRQGEIVGLLGPNGAGKTTTFYMIVGLIPPNEGGVFLDGKDLTDVPMYRRARMGVGYLSQEPSVFRKLTVEENVLAILETVKLPKKERAERLEHLLADLSLTHLRKSKGYALSGGERRRLEITRALVQRPRFMLLDEPFAGIDPIAVNDIQQIVADLRHRGIGVIISDHNVEQTLEIVDRAYIMYEGRIRVSGTVSELVWSDEVSEIYLGPTLTQRMRQRYQRPESSYERV